MNKELKFRLICFLPIAFFAFFMNKSVQAQPSPAALAACSGKQDGAECTLVAPSGTPYTGDCRQGPHGEADLACVPHPPEGAIDACNNKGEGEDCNFTAPNNFSVDGTCQSRARIKQLICIPKPFTAPTDVCQNKNQGDPCSYVNRNKQNVTGACQRTANPAQGLICSTPSPR